MKESYKIGDQHIHRIGFGTMRTTTGPGIWGETADKQRAILVIRAAIENGANLIDTADAYGPYTSELLVAEAIAPYKEKVMVATKGGFVKYKPGAVIPNGHPYYLKTAVEGSLRRLGKETIDLYFLHAVDPNIPIEESVGALKSLQEEGKINRIGLSNVSIDQLQRALTVGKIEAVQNAFNYENKKSSDLIAMTNEMGIAFIAHTPIARNTWSAEVLKEAATLGMSANQFSLAWILRYSENIIAIPGTSSIEHLLENMRTTSLHQEQYNLKTTY